VDEGKSRRQKLALKAELAKDAKPAKTFCDFCAFLSSQAVSGDSRLKKSCYPV
jgi:hypothetical protein